MDKNFLGHLSRQLDLIEKEGFFKGEKEIVSPQGSRVSLKNGKEVLNFCSNNYLGLADHPAILQAAQDALQQRGFGLASVRFICGTQDIHLALEGALTSFLETEDTILYSSCFDANGGLFEPLFDAEDALISDELNHASLIDGIRLCKAARFRYKNNDMKDLEAKLEEAKNARFKVIVTDGVFSMDGIIADLKQICALADRYNALVMVDDCHGVGFMGANGKGSIEHAGVLGRVDIVTGTFGKALGGGAGGYTSGKKEIIQMLRQRSRPYLFSNTLPPCIAGGALKALEMIQESPDLRVKLHENTSYFQERVTKLGFQIASKEHPIIPILLGEAALAKSFAGLCLEKGVYVTGFSYPVVPKGKARVRVQISAGHSKSDLDKALEVFKQAGRELRVI
jgi:glycine C-acetyltransferase